MPAVIKNLMNKLNAGELPIFARTAQSVAQTSAIDSSSLTDLASGILQDPALTGRVLKLANSSAYNRGSLKINTVSRAIMQLGFGTIRNICVSAALVEQFLKEKPRERAIREMVLALHAAIQARSFASSRKEPSAEEVYISALLFRIGYMAFWCFGGDLADKLEYKMQTSEDGGMAEEEVLGFRIHHLSAKLVKEWQLGSLLEASFKNPKSDPRSYNILLGHRLVQAARDGWDSPEMALVIKTIAKFTKQPEEDAKLMVERNAAEAIEVASHHGLGKYADLIRAVAVPQSSDDEEGPREPDLLVQLEILQELSTLLRNKKLDINLLFSTLLEGIYRGIGMDRVILLLVSGDRKSLRGKYGIGWQQHEIDRFVMTMEPLHPNVFTKAFKNKKAIWAKDTARGASPDITPEVRSRVQPPFFLMPLTVGTRPIGVICADRLPSRRTLDDENFTGFNFFCQAANAALTALATRANQED